MACNNDLQQGGELRGAHRRTRQTKTSQTRDARPASYKGTVEMRRRQARQSVLIRHYGGWDSYHSLLRRCEEYGAVRSAYNLCCLLPDDRLTVSPTLMRVCTVSTSFMMWGKDTTMSLSRPLLLTVSLSRPLLLTMSLSRPLSL